MKNRSRRAVTFTSRKPSSLVIRLLAASPRPPHPRLPPLYHFISPHPPLLSSLLGGGWWGGRSHQYPHLRYWRSPPSTSWRTELLMEFRGGRRRSNRQRGKCVPVSGSLQSIPRRWLSISRAVLPLNLTEPESH